MERRLAAILAADVVGYSRLMSEDEERALTTAADNPGALRLLISALAHLGRMDEAHDALSRPLDVTPGDTIRALY